MKASGFQGLGVKGLGFIGFIGHMGFRVQGLGVKVGFKGFEFRS